MNCNRELKTTHLKAKVWGYKGLVLGLIVALGFVNFGCKKECDISDDNSAVYYVKYEISSSTIYSGGKLDVILNKEDNTDLSLSIYQNRLEEIVVGPVKKGFNATLGAKSPTETNNHLRLYTNIYVSKNDSPFALKETNGSDLPRDSVQIRYIIDY